MSDRPTCATCPYYDAAELVDVYPRISPSYSVMTYPTPTPGCCKRHPAGSLHKKPGDWCGEHPGFSDPVNRIAEIAALLGVSPDRLAFSRSGISILGEQEAEK